MKGFCENCRDTVEYNVKMVDKEKEIKGKVIQYIGKAAYCDECKEEIFVPEIRDYNLKELDFAYRESENLIRIADIEKILVKYDIGKRPLSLLLGWGEGTLTRYVEGDTPSKPYSDMLKRILEDNEYYLEILGQNKNNITSVAFRKSMAAVERITGSMGNQESKLESAVRYLLMQTSEITPLALQKLLYFAQGFKKAFTDTFMFEEDCEAWVHGPVYHDVYHKYREYGYNPIEEGCLSYENINLTDDDKELLDHIILYFGCYSGKILETMTHSEEPWRLARRGLVDGERSERVIEKRDIDTYFKNVKDKYKMLNLTDIKDYAKDLFSKLYA
ncbi:type II toxin-antitoxin system antitoxin SocA domain-containing protein [Proteiniclasticum ruminis]|uniref:type II toxin-antitoxin system antitoxin SocA domain-containing protein n=1 Tax=Proteiniclasticum ruminis TaxID=398199 RepID=UPI0028B0B903|nr:type II toxin-antitoxin system antitoxin SocA domain-containing protein [Proteiniclasticum ruminis]